MAKKRTRTRYDADATMRLMAESNSRLTTMLEQAQQHIWRALGKSDITGDSSAPAAAESAARPPSENVAPRRKPRTLTRREREIARMIGQGMSNEQMADALTLSFDTVRSHRANIYKRLSIHSVAELMERKAEWDEP